MIGILTYNTISFNDGSLKIEVNRRQLMDWQKFDTESGAPLWFQYLPNTKNTSIGVLTKVGSRDEKWPKEAGLAHALEHMFFQGSTVSLKTQKAMSTHIESVGGISNAFTDSEETLYFHKINTSEIARSVKVLGESLFYPRFQKDIIPTQMNIVLQEMADHNDSQDSYLGMSWTKKRIAGHPLSQVTIGLKEAIENFKQEDFFRFAQKYYHPKNFTYLAVGDVDPLKLIDLINNYFPKVQKTKKHERRPCALPDKPTEKLVLYKEIEQAHICSGSIFPALTEKETYALYLFKTMIDGGMSFPLFLEIREKYGFCYSIYSEIEQKSDATFFGIGMTTLPLNYGKALDLAFKIIVRENKNEKLLKRAKMLIKGKFSLIDNTMSILSGAAKRISIRGVPLSFEENIKRYEAVTIDEVTEVVDKYLKPENFYTGVLLPKS
ncbi:MAG: pitrilysin family protein [bacterium]|nr:pitrilysin family protein [bacterium]